MKPVTVRYGRTINTGNYENERIDIEVQLDAGDTAQAALDAAKRFVERNDSSNRHRMSRERAQQIVENPDHHTWATVQQAKQLLEEPETDVF